jgi:TctA family transporter
MMLGFGVLGYIMNKLKYPIVPLVLALVLGRLAENSLRQSMMISGGSLDIFFTRPITLLFMAASILAYLTPAFRWGMKKAGYGGKTLNVESL